MVKMKVGSATRFYQKYLNAMCHVGMVKHKVVYENKKDKNNYILVPSTGIDFFLFVLFYSTFIGKFIYILYLCPFFFTDATNIFDKSALIWFTTAGCQIYVCCKSFWDRRDFCGLIGAWWKFQDQIFQKIGRPNKYEMRIVKIAKIVVTTSVCQICISGFTMFSNYYNDPKYMIYLSALWPSDSLPIPIFILGAAIESIFFFFAWGAITYQLNVHSMYGTAMTQCLLAMTQRVEFLSQSVSTKFERATSTNQEIYPQRTNRKSSMISNYSIIDSLNESNTLTLSQIERRKSHGTIEDYTATRQRRFSIFAPNSSMIEILEDIENEQKGISKDNLTIENIEQFHYDESRRKSMFNNSELESVEDEVDHEDEADENYGLREIVKDYLQLLQFEDRINESCGYATFWDVAWLIIQALPGIYVYFHAKDDAGPAWFYLEETISLYALLYSVFTCTGAVPEAARNFLKALWLHNIYEKDPEMKLWIRRVHKTLPQLALTCGPLKVYKHTFASSLRLLMDNLLLFAQW